MCLVRSCQTNPMECEQIPERFITGFQDPLLTATRTQQRWAGVRPTFSMVKRRIAQYKSLTRSPGD